jgi:hypothetical protein
MSDDIRQKASEVLRILHGARDLPPAEAAEALTPFLNLMHKQGSTDKLASASVAAVTELSRSLKENHAASDDLWQEAIEATLSLVNEVSQGSSSSLDFRDKS